MLRYLQHFRLIITFEIIVLGMSPMENEASLSAPEHNDYLKFVISVFKKSMDSIVAFVGYNANTNRAFFILVGPIFVRCRSHRLNFGSEGFHI